jgi:hypothetical protein
MAGPAGHAIRGGLERLAGAVRVAVSPHPHLNPHLNSLLNRQRVAGRLAQVVRAHP